VLEAEALTVLEMKASTPKTVELDEMAAEVAAVTCLSGWLRLGHGACSDSARIMPNRFLSDCARIECPPVA
jgi:hypothetical protein